jgi:type III secretory pathway component EscU
VEELSEITPEQVKIRLDWSGAETAHAQHVNQALAQVGSPGSDGAPDGIYITMGNAPPPAIIDGGDDARAQIERLRAEGLKVNVLGQFHMSRRMLDDLIAVLQATAVKYDAVVRLASHGGKEEQG